MHQHALRTAISLYQSGTYTLDTAATQAGITESRLQECLARRGMVANDHVTDVGTERGQVVAD